MYKNLALAVIVGLILSSSTNAFDNFHSQKAAVKKLNYDSLFSAATPIEKSSEGKKLISNCITAYGGEKHLKKLSSFKIQYYMEGLLTDEKIEVEKFFTRNRQYKIIRYQEPTVESRILNGNDSWFIGRDTSIFLYSGKYKAELFSYLTLSMPLGIKTEPFSEIRYGKRGDDALSYLYLKKNDSLMIVLGVNKKSNFIEYVEGVIYQDSTSFVFINKLDNYGIVEGFWFPNTVVNISMGLEVAKSIVTEIEINPTLKDNEFKPGSVLKSSKQSY